MKTFYEIPNLGFVKYIGHMGTDETFIEAARMSTGKGFYGWYWDEDTYNDCLCRDCGTQHIRSTLPTTPADGLFEGTDDHLCTNCWGTNVKNLKDGDVPKLAGKKGSPRDFSLLTTLYANKHQTPFEMGELAVEVEAPLFVFREWHRHRTQSYNERSARYSQMPNKHYVPDVGRIQRQSKTNKQGSEGSFDPEYAALVVNLLKEEQELVYRNYDKMVRDGVAKEIARINTPVSRMSNMRAKTDVRNWLGFLLLRMEMGAQWEIRQYANAMASIIKDLYPKTFELFLEYDLLGVRYSNTEQKFIAKFLSYLLTSATFEEKGFAMKVARNMAESVGLSEKKFEALVNKLQTNREDVFKDVLKNL